jgi:hypothetical protein
MTYSTYSYPPAPAVRLLYHRFSILSTPNRKIMNEQIIAAKVELIGKLLAVQEVSFYLFKLYNDIEDLEDEIDALSIVNLCLTGK